MKLFHEHMEKCFADMQANVESKYGKKVMHEKDKLVFRSLVYSFIAIFHTQTCDLKLDRESVIMRRNGFFMPGMFEGNNRLSETSMGSSE